MTEKTISRNELAQIVEQAFDAGATIVSYPVAMSSSYRAAALDAFRGIPTHVWVTDAAIAAIQAGKVTHGCHLGQAIDRHIEYTDGQTWVTVIPANAEEVVVIDVPENNDNWDIFADLTIEEKMATVRNMGARYVRRSVRGAKQFDDAKKDVKGWR